MIKILKVSDQKNITLSNNDPHNATFSKIVTSITGVRLRLSCLTPRQNFRPRVDILRTSGKRDTDNNGGTSGKKGTGSKRGTGSNEGQAVKAVKGARAKKRGIGSKWDICIKWGTSGKREAGSNGGTSNGGALARCEGNTLSSEQV